MPVLQEKWISDPLSEIQRLFEQRGSGGGSWGIEEFFASKISSKETLAKVPSLNSTPLDHLHNGCLVRYRCMVQDQFDPEFYLKLYHTTNTQTGHTMTCCGMYRDITRQPAGYEIDFEHPANETDDRQTLYCVPIPAETTWTKATYRNMVEGTEQSPMGGDTHQSPQLKRQLSGSDEEDEGMEVGGQEGGGEGGGGETSSSFTSKKHRTEQPDNTGPSSTASSDPGLNFPLPDEQGVPCLVKVYGNTDPYKVTSMVEFIGVLSVDPALAHFEDGGDEEQQLVDPFQTETAAERRVHSPPPSLIPRLHCIVARCLAHSNPLLPSNLTTPIKSTVYSQLCTLDVCAVRQLVVDTLTRTLMGDKLAAEYTLLHLLSSVYGRTEVLALGKFSLNLSACPPPQPTPLANTLHTALQQLLPKCFRLPMSLSNMNNWRFSPKKDYTANRLLAGILQLTDGTHVLVDETSLSPGQLSETGVKNLTALGNVTHWQKVYYDFHYHISEFSCNLPVLVLSEGKSILTVDCQVPLCPTSSSSTETVLSEAQLNQARLYLGLHRLLDYQLPSNVQKSLEDNFVEMRKEDPDMNAELFHHLLSVARLVSLSYGRGELSLAHWHHAKQLETQRRARLAS